MVMNIFDGDLATLHNDCNLSHTLISLSNVTLSPNALEKLLGEDCLCTLEEIIFHLESINITRFDKETQLLFFTRLASERFHSTCFTGYNDTICIKCSMSPDLVVNISNRNMEQLKECASTFMDEASQIPVDMKLHLACLAKNPQCVDGLLKEKPSTDPKKKNLLFYGISCLEIVDVLIKSGVDVNIRDARGRTPLFYAFISSLDSAKKLLGNGASVTQTDNRRVSVLTFFTDNMMKNHLPADVKYEGIKLFSEKLPLDQLFKQVINLILCKFIQVLGTMHHASNPHSNYINPETLCETLKLVLIHTNDGTHADYRKSLISQLQSMQERVTPDDFAVSDVLQTLYNLGAKSSAPDSEGNTCLHYATQLLFYGVPEETVTKLCRVLIEHDAKLDAKNHKEETPLLFCLSSKHLIASTAASNWSGCLQKVCEVLMENGSKLRHTNHKEESAFHLIIKIFQYAILLPDEHQKLRIFEEMFEILSRFTITDQKQTAVRKRDNHHHSSLHLLASLALKPSDLYNENVCDGYIFANLFKKILDLLLECGVILDDINENKQTPLHMCRTWTAVKLLLDAGAEPDVKDSSGCSPLLAAAKKNTCLKKDSKCFYPDVDQTPKEFWQEVLNRKLVPWTADKKGNSVLSILIKKEAYCLAKALVEIACDLESQIDAIGIPLLNAVCKDQSSENHWKLDLVKFLVDSRRNFTHSTLRGNNDTALHFSCRNILKLPDSSVETSVHWKIVQYLLLCGADINASGEAGESCLALSDNCPVLKVLLSAPVDHSALPLVLENWTQSSQIHAHKLSLVARMVKYRQVESVYFYPEALDEDKGSGGFVFAGIAPGGREVAVKRIPMSMMSNTNGSERVLVPSVQCKQIVQYLLCLEEGNFHYIAFELMEGNLEHYLDMASSAGNSTKLCKDLLMGLKLLQSQGIVHGNINPRTVFYQGNPSLCLKIGNCKTNSSRIGWVATEVLKDETSFSKQSDIFSCGLVLHYLLSGKKHPFAPVDSATKAPQEVHSETHKNITNGNIVKIDDSLTPEATHLVHLMLDSNPNHRPSAVDALVHPFFWDNETKKKFLHAVGNEPEIAMNNRPHPMLAFESELQGRFNVIVSRGTTWNDSPPYDNMSATYAGMRRRKYDFETVAGLIRFIRNAYEHINEQPKNIQELWEEDFVLNDYFPKLVIEVYKALTTSEFHQLHKDRQGIKKFFRFLNKLYGEG